MKTILLTSLVAFFTACSTGRELQADLVNAELVKIDTVTRHYIDAVQQQRQLTWRDINNMEYVTFVPIHNTFPVGYRMMVIMPK